MDRHWEQGSANKADMKQVSGESGGTGTQEEQQRDARGYSDNMKQTKKLKPWQLFTARLQIKSHAK